MYSRLPFGCRLAKHAELLWCIESDCPAAVFMKKSPIKISLPVLAHASRCVSCCVSTLLGDWNNIANTVTLRWNLVIKKCTTQQWPFGSFWSFGLPCAVTATIWACGFGWVTWCQNMRTTTAATSRTRTSWRIALLNANLQLMRSEVNPRSHSVKISISYLTFLERISAGALTDSTAVIDWFNCQGTFALYI